MTMTWTLTTGAFIALFLAIGIGIVGWPFVRARRGMATMPVKDDSLEQLRLERDRIYTSLRDLELDEQLGEITRSDYLNLTERYKMQAVGILKRIDADQRDALLALDEEVEEAIALARRTPRAPKQIQCVSCSAKMSDDDRFCRKCGTPVQVEHACRVCATPLSVDDRFCPKCGAGSE